MATDEKKDGGATEDAAPSSEDKQSKKGSKRPVLAMTGKQHTKLHTNIHVVLHNA